MNKSCSTTTTGAAGTTSNLAPNAASGAGVCNHGMAVSSTQGNRPASSPPGTNTGACTTTSAGGTVTGSAGGTVTGSTSGTVSHTTSSTTSTQTQVSAITHIASIVPAGAVEVSRVTTSAGIIVIYRVGTVLYHVTYLTTGGYTYFTTTIPAAGMTGRFAPVYVSSLNRAGVVPVGATVTSRLALKGGVLVTYGLGATFYHVLYPAVGLYTVIVNHTATLPQLVLQGASTLTATIPSTVTGVGLGTTVGTQTSTTTGPRVLGVSTTRSTAGAATSHAATTSRVATTSSRGTAGTTTASSRVAGTTVSTGRTSGATTTRAGGTSAPVLAALPRTGGGISPDEPIMLLIFSVGLVGLGLLGRRLGSLSR